MAAEVTRGHQGQGLGALVLSALKGKAREHGLQRMIAPARPTMKARYPLTPIDRYAGWKRRDGELYDPWLRTHERLGAKVIATTTRSMRIEGTVREWEGWAKMEFPETGSYIVPDALHVVQIDRERDLGVYDEPAVWMRHL
jgi:GNAT superfamily N-acetyltransferase